MSTTAIRVPAGWYADPVKAAAHGMVTQRRWWDGTAWTHHTAALDTPVSPVVSAESLAAATASAQPSASFSVAGSAPATVSPRESARAAEAMPLHPVDPAAGVRSVGSAPRASAMSPVSPANAETAGYEPFSHRNRIELTSMIDAGSARNPLRLRVHTVSVWLMATMPLTQALLVFWVFSTLPAESSAWTRALAVVFPLVLMGALAGQDTRLMELSGHLRTAPWITAVLAPPLYLGVRGVRVQRTTGATPWPLAVWLGAQLAVVATWFALDPEGVLAVVRAVS
ncbi:DUF2510 domain-containing protein [Microcella humidisoli]|uniref:DUF2510 domain-containing protein n=1 Tax=Microcella humidisoli TaxID=2963406 RepID=A0ABY5FWB5_9MICO|nr:DUF2510 domain-containing protein [Microcella humidisoli]UTT62563.1 DUF2510 domain-containing protein [Microcella humidisoli]